MKKQPRTLSFWLLSRWATLVCLSLSTALSSANTTDPIREPCAKNYDSIQRPPKVAVLNCDRPFEYRGQTYPTDSAQAQDAAILKTYVSSVNSANELLEKYQSNRTKSQISAYTGTAGLLLFAFSGLISKQFSESSQNSIKSALSIGGLSLAAGGFVYSFALLKTNELLIPKAVNEYNRAKPNDPIQLQFKAGWSF